MNEVIKCLTERRSARHYGPRQVEPDVLDQILLAGTYAPTGMGRQSPVIVAVQDPATVKQLSRMNAAVMGSDGDPFYGAPTVLVVLADKNVGTYLYDGSLVMGNLMNAAHALGVDSCWIHRAKEEFESEEGKALLKSGASRGIWKALATASSGMPIPPKTTRLPVRKAMWSKSCKGNKKASCFW